MYATNALESIAGLLPILPDESVEGLLATYESLVTDEAMRTAAAQILRNAAAACHDTKRCGRLLRAASAIATGQACSLTAEELTAKQAAAAQSVTQAEWEARIVEEPLPPPPGDDDQEEDEDAPNMADEPPKLPHLHVRYFFSGLVVRAGRDFADVYGRAVCSTDLLTVFVNKQTEEGHTIAFLDRNIHLRRGTSNHDEIIDNAGNAWFQPVPAGGCLSELIEAIEVRLNKDEETDDAEDEEYYDRIEAISEEVGECADWLAEEGERGPVPKCRSGRLAAKVFGRESELAVWIPFLFAAVGVLMDE